MPTKKAVTPSPFPTTAMPLGKEFADLVSGPIYQTWQEIESDAYQLAAENNDKMTNAGAMELVLDANRMSSSGGSEGEAADKIVDAMTKKYGYIAVAKVLRRYIKLV